MNPQELSTKEAQGEVWDTLLGQVVVDGNLCVFRTQEETSKLKTEFSVILNDLQTKMRSSSLL